MNIREFAFNLQKLYEEMGQTFSAYQQASGLSCMSGCGRCCLNPDVEASILEMLPLALRIYDEKNVDEWINRLETSEQKHCLVYQSVSEGKGQCGFYQERPSICRMFGVAGSLDKRKEVTLSICKFLKEEYPEKVELLKTEKKADAPILMHWASRLIALHPELIKERYAINDALRRALERIEFYAQYQKI